jgi:ATP sulfurylase
MGSLEYCLSLFYCATIILFVVWQTSFERRVLKDYVLLKLRHVFYCKHCGEIYFNVDNCEEQCCRRCSTKNTSLSF